MQKYIFIFMLTVTILAGCKKDKHTNDNNTQKIQGKWEVTLTREVYYNNGKLQTKEKSVASAGVVFEFAGSNLNYISDGETETYPFTVEGNEIVIDTDSGVLTFFKFKFSSDNQLELSQTETETVDGVTYEESFTYVMKRV